ncbi:hypothetical protein A7P85_08725 [Eikenella corrodens]|uniref:Morphogenetic protein n=1 Tax=Eikenella corrodens TaxID=539 RepID=A0A1A9R9C8_EIKCO|nr:hypothetical protein [Eikenella corrodens]OAM15255.1 hypothetical protein A7P85_08725 [Eikenella corrodens]
MKERPILFSGPMVRAILEGRKTQTRRIVNPQPKNRRGGRWMYCYESMNKKLEGSFYYSWPDKKNGNCFSERGPESQITYRCPYGQVGDRLWVREAWAVHPETGSLLYRADDNAPENTRWKPSIHMPRKHSRILLEMTSIRVERLQTISWEDALAEGTDNDQATTNAVGSFVKYWDYINGAEAWDMNPWVWVIGFKKVEV